MGYEMLIIENETWQPSTFYDSKTTLKWIMNYSLFKKVYTNKVKPGNEYKYAIHNDVYKAFLYKYKNCKRKQTKKKKKNKEK